MVQLDVYSYAQSKSADFFNSPIENGAVVWLDEGGFSNSFFKSKETNELISFIPVAGDVPAFPSTPKEFEAQRFVEAQIIEPADSAVKVKISWVQTLGQWARAANLASDKGLAAVPEEFRPNEETLAKIKDTLRTQESFLWISDKPYDKSVADVRALFFFKGDSDKRGMIFTTNGSPSYLVKLKA